MADDGKSLPGTQIVTTIPDPTTLTNQLVERAVSALREIGGATIRQSPAAGVTING